jgi:hypothetical protein
MTSTMDAPAATTPLIQVGPQQNETMERAHAPKARSPSWRSMASPTTEIAKDLGKSLSALSKYLNQKPEGDVFKPGSD